MSWRSDESYENSAGKPGTPLPTDVATLRSRIEGLEAELKDMTAFNQHLVASLARLQAERALPRTIPPTTRTPNVTNTKPTTTTTTTTLPTPSAATTAPQPRPHPSHHPPCTIATGSGAASPEVFQEVIKTNWHGRLGRTHMVDVDALPATALVELDCLLRRKLHAIYPRAHDIVVPNADAIFASLAALGLRLEDRGAYADLPITRDLVTLRSTPTIKRLANSVAWYAAYEKYADYWQGLMLETLVELARYRGLFDDEGYLKE